MLHETANKLFCRQFEIAEGFCSVIEILKSDFIAVIVPQFGLSDSGPFNITAKIADILFMIGGGPAAMNDPLFFVEPVKKTVESESVADLFFYCWRYDKSRRCFAEQLDDFITPHFHKSCLVKEKVFPFSAVAGDAATSDRKMDMDIAFEIAAKGVNCDKNAKSQAFFIADAFYTVSGNSANLVEQPAVAPEEVPELRGHGESNVLPCGCGQHSILFLYPCLCGLFATGRTGP